MSNAQTADRVLGRRIYRFDAVTSTNDVARALAVKEADEGTAVVADEQTSGRGSRGRVWLGEPGVNLLLSVILRPDLEPHRLFELAFVAAVGVADYLINDADLPARVKWPNDVLVGGRKIAGVLVEAAPSQDGRATAVMGIGLNVNWTQLPDDIAQTATSLQLETGRVADMECVLQGILNHLDSAYSRFVREGFGVILSRWQSLERSTGSAVRVEIDGVTVEGQVDGIDTEGALIVRLRNGDVQRMSAASLIVASQQEMEDRLEYDRCS